MFFSVQNTNDKDVHFRKGHTHSAGVWCFHNRYTSFSVRSVYYQRCKGCRFCSGNVCIHMLQHISEQLSGCREVQHTRMVFTSSISTFRFSNSYETEKYLGICLLSSSSNFENFLETRICPLSV